MPEPAPPSPRHDGVEPTFRHLDDDDVAWQAVKAQRNADGSVAHVWEKWLAFSADPPYLTLYARYDPGMVVRRHGHFSPHVVFVLEGEVSFGDRPLPGRDPRRAPARRRLRTVVAGPEGAVMFEVMMGDPRQLGRRPRGVLGGAGGAGGRGAGGPAVGVPRLAGRPAGALGRGAGGFGGLRPARRGALVVLSLGQAARSIMKGTRSAMKRRAGESSKPAKAPSMEPMADRATPVANSLAKAMLP